MEGRTIAVHPAESENLSSRTIYNAVSAINITSERTDYISDDN